MRRCVRWFCRFRFLASVAAIVAAGAATQAASLEAKWEFRAASNYFDLLPGAPVTITLKAGPAVMLDQLRGAISVVLLTDTFPTAPTMH